MKKLHLVKWYLLAVVFFLSLSAHSQQKVPRNYVGGLAVFDLTYIGIGGALEYERWLLVKRKWVFSAKADYVFAHKVLNLFWTDNDQDKTNNQLCLMGSAYFFSGKKNDHEGFFAGASVGLNYMQRQQNVYNGTSTVVESRTVISPGHELFLGGQTNFRNGGSFKLTVGAYQFYTKREGIYPENPPLISFYTKISFGF